MIRYEFDSFSLLESVSASQLLVLGFNLHDSIFCVKDHKFILSIIGFCSDLKT
jgi:hypothetical protein